MNNSATYLKLPLALALAAATTLMMLLGGNVKQANAAEGVCPTFRVLHNDRIGALSLPRGTYNVTTLDSAKLSCATASKLFARFLQDYDGKLQKPWIVNAAAKSFTKGRGSTTGFKVAKTRAGGTPGTSTPASCPGYFRVLHNDSIGNFKVPAGRYRLSLIDSKQRLTCKKAAVNFSEFLQDFDGKLIAPWKLKKSSATFYKSTNPKLGFNINKAYGPDPAPKPSGKYARCPGTFRVQHNDRIGRLRLPKGPYYITVRTKSSLTCKGAASLFAQFLQRTDGRLPAPWKLNPAKARFRNGRDGQVFRVQQAR